MSKPSIAFCLGCMPDFFDSQHHIAKIIIQNSVCWCPPFPFELLSTVHPRVPPIPQDWPQGIPMETFAGHEGFQSRWMWRRRLAIGYETLLELFLTGPPHIFRPRNPECLPTVFQLHATVVQKYTTVNCRARLNCPLAVKRVFVLSSRDIFKLPKVPMQ